MLRYILPELLKRALLMHHKPLQRPNESRQQAQVSKVMTDPNRQFVNSNVKYLDATPSASPMS